MKNADREQIKKIVKQHNEGKFRQELTEDEMSDLREFSIKASPIVLTGLFSVLSNIKNDPQNVVNLAFVEGNKESHLVNEALIDAMFSVPDSVRQKRLNESASLLNECGYELNVGVPEDATAKELYQEGLISRSEYQEMKEEE